MLRFAIIVGVVALSGCAQLLIGPEEGAKICEERARAARGSTERQGPTGRATIGANSNSGGFVSVGVGVDLSSNSASGLDPVEVYEICVFDLTAAAPIRPPVLN